MTEKEQSESTWRYWAERAAARAVGRSEEHVLKPLSYEYNFYGQLALEDLGDKVSTPPTAFKPSSAELRAMAENPSIRRALELYRLYLRVDATREWVWAIRGFDDRRLLVAAEIARRNQIFDRAINTADKTESLHDFSLRYLAPYRDVLKVHAKEMNLDEAWVYGLIRQESRFIVDARSSAGASGLMQLMPATAKWVARKMGIKGFRSPDVTEVDTNISLGTYYLKHVLDSLDGYPVLASAAYNAGPARARVAYGCRDRRRDLCRDDSVQRNARLREESDVQRDLLRAQLQSADAIAQAASWDDRPAPARSRSDPRRHALGPVTSDAVTCRY